MTRRRTARALPRYFELLYVNMLGTCQGTSSSFQGGRSHDLDHERTTLISTEYLGGILDSPWRISPGNIQKIKKSKGILVQNVTDPYSY